MGTWEHFFQPIFEFSGFSADFLISKMAKIRVFKGPFSPENRPFRPIPAIPAMPAMVAWLHGTTPTPRIRGNFGKISGNMGTWEHGNIFFRRFLNFPDFQLIFLFQKWRKFAFSKAPPFDFPPKTSDSESESECEWALQKCLLQGADFKGSSL